MTAHTPGPWRYEASTKTIRAVPSNYWLATMDSWDGAVNHEANAALIARAPELQDALRWLTDCVETYLQDGDHALKDVEHALDRARKAMGGV